MWPPKRSACRLKLTENVAKALQISEAVQCVSQSSRCIWSTKVLGTTGEDETVWQISFLKAFAQENLWQTEKIEISLKCVQIYSWWNGP